MIRKPSDFKWFSFYEGQLHVTLKSKFSQNDWVSRTRPVDRKYTLREWRKGRKSSLFIKEVEVLHGVKVLKVVHYKHPLNMLSSTLIAKSLLLKDQQLNTGLGFFYVHLNDREVSSSTTVFCPTFGHSMGAFCLLIGLRSTINVVFWVESRLPLQRNLARWLLDHEPMGTA